MFRLLEKLQERPERERFAITIATAAGVTGIIFIAWVVALGARFADGVPPATSVADSVQAVRFSDLIRDAGSFAPLEQTAGAAAPADGAASSEDSALIESVEPETNLPTETPPFEPARTFDSPVRIEPVGEYQIR